MSFSAMVLLRNEMKWIRRIIRHQYNEVKK